MFAQIYDDDGDEDDDDDHDARGMEITFWNI